MLAYAQIKSHFDYVATLLLARQHELTQQVEAAVKDKLKTQVVKQVN